MSNIHCQDIHQKWINGLPLSEAEQSHVASCGECETSHHEMSALVAELDALGNLGATTVKPEPDMLARVQSAVLLKMAEEAPTETPAPAEQPRSSLSEWLDSILQAFTVPRLGWAITVLVVAIVGSGIGMKWHATQPIGEVDFAKTEIRVLQDGKLLSYQGVPSEAELLRGTGLETGDQGAIFHLGDAYAIRVAMAAQTRLSIVGPRELKLEQGEVWLKVTPGGKGFAVHTQNGSATVLGTEFGVRDMDDQMQVDVIRGRVRVAQADVSTEVTVGEYVTASATGLGTIATRPAGAETPDWVMTLKYDEDKARTSMYVPSVEVGP